MTGRVLVVGGSDNTGAGGIQGDVKVVAALGGDAAAVVTSLTVQDDEGFRSSVTVAPSLIREQMEAALKRRDVDAVKVGLLADPASVDAVADALEAVPDVPLVLATAFRAWDGRNLADAQTIGHVKRRLAYRTAVLVATGPEAAALAGIGMAAEASRQHIAEMLLTIGAETVILTDENGPDDMVVDCIAGLEGDGGSFSFPRPRGVRVRGVCGALATAVATFLARGSDRATAIQQARLYVAGAVANASAAAGASASLNHAYAVVSEPFQRG